jgi:hypothetical protein
LRAAPTKGVNRVVWDLRYASPSPVRAEGRFNPLARDDSGFMVMPGKYRVTVAKVIGDAATPLGESREFTAKVLRNATLPAENRAELVEFQKKVAELTRVLQGTLEESDALAAKLLRIRQTVVALPGAAPELLPKVAKAEKALDEIAFLLRGHQARASFEEVPPAHLPIQNRVEELIGIQFSTTSKPGRNQTDSYAIAREELAPLLEKLMTIKTVDVPALEKELDKRGAPWTPGRILDIK